MSAEEAAAEHVGQLLDRPGLRRLVDLAQQQAPAEDDGQYREDESLAS